MLIYGWTIGMDGRMEMDEDGQVDGRMAMDGRMDGFVAMGRRMGEVGGGMNGGIVI
jgi:hypothetical protein